jgi:hypothetical protein
MKNCFRIPVQGRYFNYLDCGTGYERKKYVNKTLNIFQNFFETKDTPCCGDSRRCD